MKVVSYTICHYGKDYLPWSLRSVAARVESLDIFYTPHPSHGHASPFPPPEVKCELIDSLESLLPDIIARIRWHETDFWEEGPQRDHALQTCAESGTDLVLVVDCDEVWQDQVLGDVLAYVWEENSARNWLVNMVHFWRSFSYASRDNNWPVRVIDLRHAGGTGYVPKSWGDVYHFGYAVRDSIMQYKMSIHGHHNEWRPGWYEKKWRAWPPPADCHPTNGDGWWNPQPFDKSLLPEFMREHPFYDLERIE